jgi:hypothetical protein
MMKPQPLKSILLVLCMLLGTVLQAQHFRYQSKLNTVRQTGFYRIPVIPELSAYMKTDLGDVRIWDKAGKQVPYIVRKNKSAQQNSYGELLDSFTVNPSIQFSQTDSSNGISYLKVVQQKRYPISDIRLAVDGPKYFLRMVRVLLLHQERRRRQHWYDLVASFRLSSSEKVLHAPVPVFKDSIFYLEIDNGDNPPLKVTSVITSQECYDLVAWLESGNSYKLVMDAEDAAIPHYDLQQFKDSIPANAPVLYSGPITPISATEIRSGKEGFPRAGMWLIMAGAVAVLGLLTWRLTAEMRRNNN